MTSGHPNSGTHVGRQICASTKCTAHDDATRGRPTRLRCAVRSDGVTPARSRRRASTSWRKSPNVVVITGAGSRRPRGFPTFVVPRACGRRDPQGRTTLEHRRLHLLCQKSEKQAWGTFAVDDVASRCSPIRRTSRLVAFERTGKLTALVTQNIDGLHVKAGSIQNLVIEVHGNSRTTRCLRCGDEMPTATILERVAAGERDPHCHAVVDGRRSAADLLKTAVVSFGQPLPDAAFARAEYLAKTCDL